MGAAALPNTKCGAFVNAKKTVPTLITLTMAADYACSLHAGAKAGQRHERVALTPQQEPAQCDICQVWRRSSGDASSDPEPSGLQDLKSNSDCLAT